MHFVFIPAEWHIQSVEVGAFEDLEHRPASCPVAEAHSGSLLGSSRLSGGSRHPALAVSAFATVMIAPLREVR